MVGTRANTYKSFDPPRLSP